MNPGSVGRGIGLVVLVPEVQDGKIDLVVDYIAKGVFKGSGKDLFIETDRDELALGIAMVFVLRHTPPVVEGF